MKLICETYYTSSNLDINFENFVQIYYEDMEHRLCENTMRTKKFIIDLKSIWNVYEEYSLT